MKTIGIEVKNWKWKDGARIKADPMEIGKEIDRLTNGTGKITVDKYVNEARNENSPLYNTLTHDKDVAIEKLNKMEARHVLGCLLTVSVDIIDGKEITTERPQVINVSERNGEYTRTEIAMSNIDTREIALKEAKAQLKWFRKKYAFLKELANVFKAVDEILKDDENL